MIPTGEEGWERSAVLLLGDLPAVCPQTLWGTMGIGCPAYHEPTYFVEGQNHTETPKGLPILQTVFRGENLSHEQDVFDDIQTPGPQNTASSQLESIEKEMRN